MTPPRPRILAPPRRRRLGRLGAFTLIELMVVIALAALMATLVTVSLTGNLRAARAQDVAQSIATSDRLAREYARHFGRPVRLVFDLSQSTLPRAASDAGDSSHNSILQLPSGVKIARLVTATTDTTAGQISIPCSGAGQTPSYALLLTSGRGDRHWTITAGLTGQTTTASDENEVRDIFTALRPTAPTGHDAR
jgi:type II secretion system protein H